MVLKWRWMRWLVRQEKPGQWSLYMIRRTEKLLFAEEYVGNCIITSATRHPSLGKRVSSKKRQMRWYDDDDYDNDRHDTWLVGKMREWRSLYFFALASSSYGNYFIYEDPQAGLFFYKQLTPCWYRLGIIIIKSPVVWWRCIGWRW